jgi:SAM-dependent methyltransferase
MAGIGKNDFALEVGCARGAGSFFLAEQFGCRVLGLDSNVGYITDAVKTAKCKGYSNVSFMAAGADNLPLKSESVTAVISEASFSLLADKSRAAKEFWRITKTGGHVIINDFTTRGEVDELLRKKMRFSPLLPGRKKLMNTRKFLSGMVSGPVLLTMLPASWLALFYGQARHTKANLPISAAQLQIVWAVLPAEQKQRDETVCSEFFCQARLGYAQLIFVKEARVNNE